MRNYELIDELGSGAYSTVYRARRLADNLIVALKQLKLPSGLDAHEEGLLLDRFRAEADAAHNLNHSGIVSIIEAGEDEGVYFIAFEYIEGRTLQAELSEGRKFKPSEIISIGRQLAEALAYAHQHGIIHRDIKPGNIMITPDGRALITDFGVAKLLGTDTHGGESGAAFVGTPQYSSPEQVTASQIDARTDIFSLGAVLYEMAAHRPAFGGESLGQIIHRITSVQAEPLRKIDPSFPPGLENVIFKCLAKDPAFRYQNATDLAYALLELAPETGATPTGRQWQAARRDSDEAALLVAAGPQEGREIKLHPSITTIGRKTGDITFPDDDSLDNQHAWITNEDGSYFLYDSGTKEGTFVSGKRVERIGLNNGDEISMGRQRFIYSGPSATTGSTKPLTVEDVLPSRKPRMKPIGKYWWVVGAGVVIVAIIAAMVYLFALGPRSLAAHYDQELVGLYGAWDAAFIRTDIKDLDGYKAAAGQLPYAAYQELKTEIDSSGAGAKPGLWDSIKIERKRQMEFISDLYMAAEKIKDSDQDKLQLATDLGEINGSINLLQSVEDDKDWVARMSKASSKLYEIISLAGNTGAGPGPLNTNRDRAAAALYKAVKAYQDKSNYSFDQILTYFKDADDELLELKKSPKEEGFADYNLAICYYFTANHLMTDPQYYTNADNYLSEANRFVSNFEGRSATTKTYMVLGIDETLYNPMKLEAEIELSADRLYTLAGWG